MVPLSEGFTNIYEERWVTTTRDRQYKFQSQGPSTGPWVRSSVPLPSGVYCPTGFGEVTVDKV